MVVTGTEVVEESKEDDVVREEELEIFDDDNLAIHRDISSISEINAI